MAGVASALGVALVIKRTHDAVDESRALLMELPEYHWPHLRNLLLGLWERTQDLPRPRGHDHPYAHGRAVVPGKLPVRRRPVPPALPSSTASPACSAAALEHVFAPIGFNWQICSRWCPGWRRAKSRSAPGHGVCDVGRRRHDRRADADDRPQLEPGHRAVAAGLVRVRAAVPVDAGRGASRETNSWRYPLIMAGVPVRTGLRRGLHHLPCGAGAGRRGRRMSLALQGMWWRSSWRLPDLQHLAAAVGERARARAGSARFAAGHLRDAVVPCGARARTAARMAGSCGSCSGSSGDFPETNTW